MGGWLHGAKKVTPGLLDRYLARAGYDAQQTDEPVEPERPSNLWEPLVGDRGTHGVFDAEARARSIQLWLARHRILLIGAGAAALVAGRRLR